MLLKRVDGGLELVVSAGTVLLVIDMVAAGGAENVTSKFGKGEEESDTEEEDGGVKDPWVGVYEDSRIESWFEIGCIDGETNGIGDMK